MVPGEAAFRALIEQASDTVILLDTDGTIAYANAAAEDLFGRRLSDLIGEHFGDVAISEAHSEIYLPHPRRGTVATNIRRLTIQLQDLAYTALYLRDVTERVEAEERLRRSAVALDAIDQGLVITRPDTTIVDVNPAFTTITGYTREEVLDKTPACLLSGRREDEEIYREVMLALERDGHWLGDIHNRRKNGELYQTWLSISPVRRDNGELIYYVALFSDMTAINKLRHLAHHDHLTGLYNRASLQKHLDEEMRRIDRYGNIFSVIMFDLDRFKAINDQYGHAVGDAILQRVAKLTGEEVRDTDILARWGGEEFMILLPATDIEHAVILAERLRKRIAGTEFEEAGNITVSLGIAEPQPNETQRQLLIRVDQALYEAKKSGRNSWVKSLSPDERSAS